jgi:GNAT superfamily N-acetyltransferase
VENPPGGTMGRFAPYAVSWMTMFHSGSVIRRGRLPDVDALKAIDQLSWRKVYGRHVPRGTLDGLLQMAATSWPLQLQGMLEGESWVLERAGTIEGYLTLGASRDEDARPGDGELHTLYLHPDRVGRGVGGALLRHGEARLQTLGHSAATLWVFVANTHARGFYEHHGWRLDDHVGVMPWEGWVTLVRYRKELPVTAAAA